MGVPWMRLWRHDFLSHRHEDLGPQQCGTCTNFTPNKPKNSSEEGYGKCVVSGRQIGVDCMYGRMCEDFNGNADYILVKMDERNELMHTRFGLIMSEAEKEGRAWGLPQLF